MKYLTGIQCRLKVAVEELAPPFPPFWPRHAAAGSPLHALIEAASNLGVTEQGGGLSPDRRRIGDANHDRVHNGRYRGNRQDRFLCVNVIQSVCRDCS
jgi:hypothetical protein